MNQIDLSTGHYRSYHTSFSNQLVCCLKSPIITTLFFSTLSCALYTLSPPIGAVVGTITMINTIRSYKKLTYEFLLTKNIIKNFFFQWSWWNEVEEGIFLGAVPLSQLGHENTLLNKLGIKTIITVLENFEYQTSSIFGKAIAPERWRERSINHLHIRSADFYPLSLYDLDRGARYLYAARRTGKKRAYIHCKSGVGRSLSIYLAYRVLEGDNPDEAWRRVRGIRPYITSFHSNHMQRVREYHRLVHNQS